MKSGCVKINIFIKLFLIVFVFNFIFCSTIFAGKLDPTIPTPMACSLDNDGKAEFMPGAYGGGYKRFDLQLLKRVTTLDVSGWPVYTYKTSGGIKYCSADDNEFTFTFSSVGYYQFRIRAENLEGNYSEWAQISDDPYYEGTPVEENDITVNPSGGGGGDSGGSGYDYNTGPGVINYNNMGNLPAGYQYAVVGPNGEILYYYTGNQNYNQQYGPGYYVNNNGQIMYPNNMGYQVVPPPNVNGNYYNGVQQYSTNLNNPNYSFSNAMGGVNPTYSSPMVGMNTQIGWNVDNIGRFYYNGNNQILKGTWYLIDGAYYRFGDTGYVLANQWFQDNSTGSWYYLAGDGKMVTGWQKINGVWYYFKPESGNGYGSMYMNTTLFINDQYGQGYYAFGSTGAMIQNAWYGGAYYGQDGKRTS